MRSSFIVCSALGALALSACADLGDAPVDSESDSTQSALGTPAVQALELVGMTHYERAEGAGWTTTKRMRGELVWPSAYDLLPASNVRFTWAPGAIPADVASVASGNGYALDVYLNGQKLVRPAQGGPYAVSPSTAAANPLCPSGETCLDLSVAPDALFAAAFPWTLKVVFWDLGRTPTVRSSLGEVDPNPYRTSYFKAKIAPIFQHARCSTCHALGSKQKLIDAHAPYDIEAIAPFEETVTPHGTQLRCGSGCHTGVAAAVPGKTFTETEWMSPKSDMGIDWTGKTASQICAKVKANLTSPSAMKKHFFDDARIGWAVHSGVVPTGQSLDKAPPGDFFTFQDVVTAWIDGGRPCP